MAGNVREIAAKANVSIATVSRVLHQAENVKAETREKVEEAMKEMGLIPEDLIRSAKRDGRTVGVLIPDLTNSFFADVIQGIEERAEQMGMKVVICHTKDSDRTEIQYLRLMKELQVAGIIITPVSDDDDNVNNEYLNLLSNMKIPVVLVDRDVKYTGHAGVFIDNEYGAFEATKLLLENGHSNIALIAGPTNTVPGRGRRKGYQDAFKFMNIPVREELIFNGDFSITSGKLITRHILADYPDVTAIFSCNNHMTLGCISELMEVGKKIPDDMALVGFDDLPLVKILHYQLTVVDRSSREMGYQAMKLMSKMLKGGKSGVEQRIILTPKLIVRGSGAAMPKMNWKEEQGMKKVAVVGSFVVDLMARTPHLPEPGETVMGSYFKAGPGGKGANQAAAAKRAGSELVFSTKIGTDSFAEIARDSFKANGIPLEYVFENSQVPTGAALISVDEITSQNEIVVVLGACSTFTDEDIKKLEEALKDCEYLLLQMEINPDATEKLIRLANKIGIKVILNTAPVQKLTEELYPLLELVTPNEVEAKILTGIACDDTEGCRKAAQAFFEKGVKQVIITIGKRGVYYNDGKREEIISNYDVPVVDTTGAGDAFNGGLLAGLSQGMDLLSAARYGNVVSNLAVTKMGTAPAMPSKKEIQEFIKNHKVEL